MSPPLRPSVPPATLAEDVRRGLTSAPKTLPPYLFYDAAGSRLYERITELPEYYLTRAEREIFVAHSAEIVDRVARSVPGPLGVIELGAGSASKTEILLRAVLARHGRGLYLPIDVSATALTQAESRLRDSLPQISVRPLAMTHAEALRVIADVAPPRLVLFIGSSVGNLPDGEASALLRRTREALPGETWLLLGTDLRTSPDVHRAAYDDAAGVTAQFNRNVLAVINRELDADFDLDAFRHVATWNSEDERMEMWLRAERAQRIYIGALDLAVEFAAGEKLLTELSCKFRPEVVAAELAQAGLRRNRWWTDTAGDFGLSLSVK